MKFQIQQKFKRPETVERLIDLTLGSIGKPNASLAPGTEVLLTILDYKITM